MKIVHNIFILILLIMFYQCDNSCRKDNIFDFSYPNEINQREFIFDIDYSEIPVDKACISIGIKFSVTNCDDKNNLILEVYARTVSPDYYLYTSIEAFPAQTKDFYDWIPSECSVRFISVILKGLNSDCFNGEINIHPRYITDKCYWGIDEGWYIED